MDLNGKATLALSSVRSEVIQPMTGWAGVVKAGQYIRLTDPHGRQCGDFWAFNADDLDEHLSAMHTRVWVNKLCPEPGESFHSNHRRPVLQVIADTCRVHDLLTAACDEHRYRLYGLQHSHRSCAGNLREVMEPYFGTRPFYVPQPFNIFANVPVGADGSVLNGPAPSKPGDYIVMKAWIDLVVAISACPQEFNPIAGWYPTEMHVDIMEPERADG
ncbi:urea carboxylase-associated family protein [Pseudoxanthobacter sp.]|uniref:urea carboxylase-associated family protein n=1 Tax=Pseudoxanthobacter sp. TaxID=1925742 RepID=UPI002FE33D70